MYVGKWKDLIERLQYNLKAITLEYLDKFNGVTNMYYIPLLSQKLPYLVSKKEVKL